MAKDQKTVIGAALVDVRCGHKPGTCAHKGITPRRHSHQGPLDCIDNLSYTSQTVRCVDCVNHTERADLVLPLDVFAKKRNDYF